MKPIVIRTETKTYIMEPWPKKTQFTRGGNIKGIEWVDEDVIRVTVANGWAEYREVAVDYVTGISTGELMTSEYKPMEP